MTNKTVGERCDCLISSNDAGFPDVGDTVEYDDERYRVVEILDGEGSDTVEATLEFLGRTPYRGEYED